VTAAVTLRHAQPALRHGSFRVLVAHGPAIAWLRERDGETPIVVALNNGEAEASIEVELPAGAAPVLRAIPLPGDTLTDDVPVGGGRAVIRIPARSGRVLAGRSARRDR
jgi:hypothetical protein